MSTSVHIPEKLLRAVDRRAKALGVSRNKLVVQALEREVRGRGWSPGFFEMLLNVDEEGKAAVDEMLAAIHRNRSSKKPIEL